MVATRKGVELEPYSGRAHANRAFALMFAKDPATVDEAEEAVRPYDRDLTAVNLFDLQDEITDNVVSSIGGIYGIVYRAGM